MSGAARSEEAHRCAKITVTSFIRLLQMVTPERGMTSKFYLHVLVAEDSFVGFILNFLLHAEVNDSFLDDVLIVSESVLLNK